MLQKKKRSVRVRRVATLMGLLCFVVAGGRLLTGAAPMVDPTLAGAHVTCTFWQCELVRDPARLIADTNQRSGPVDDEAIRRLMVQPPGRPLIAAGSLTAAIPASLMFLFLALAFRAVGSRRDFAAAARWLRRAAVAAMVLAFAYPVAATLRATALSPITTGKQQLYLMFNGGDFLWGIMLAASAWVAVWALEQGLRSERALAEIV
jgi:hypothetical protein